MLTLLTAMIVNANQNNLFSNQTLFTKTAMNCLTDDVLNCIGGADGHHIYEKETECPIGGEKFKALYLGTHSTYGRHLDWEPVSYMRFPVPIPVCPGNGFVITKEKL